MHLNWYQISDNPFCYLLDLMRHKKQFENHVPRQILKTDITIAALNESRLSPPNGDANFDSNMVIILAVLLCALICVLGLNSIVRCALRCTRRLVLETTSEGVSLRLATTGIPKEALCGIPVVVYKSGIDIPATDCPICLGEFTEGEKVRILPGCNHGFHVKCIDAWLVSHSSCPNCRQVLFGPEHHRDCLVSPGN